MNWKQLYTTSTEQERLEALIQMLQTIEARQNKIIPVLPLSKSHFDLGRGKGWGLIRNRRQAKKFHIINDQRGRHTLSRLASVITILATLFATAFTSILIAIHAPAHFATQILFFPITAIIFVFLFKPNRQSKIVNPKC